MCGFIGSKFRQSGVLIGSLSPKRITNLKVKIQDNKKSEKGHHIIIHNLLIHRDPLGFSIRHVFDFAKLFVVDKGHVKHA